MEKNTLEIANNIRFMSKEIMTKKEEMRVKLDAFEQSLRKDYTSSSEKFEEEFKSFMTKNIFSVLTYNKWKILENYNDIENSSVLEIAMSNPDLYNEFLLEEDIELSYIYGLNDEEYELHLKKVIELYPEVMNKSLLFLHVYLKRLEYLGTVPEINVDNVMVYVELDSIYFTKDDEKSNLLDFLKEKNIPLDLEHLIVSVEKYENILKKYKDLVESCGKISLFI
jgi:hypothetical protein